MGKALIHSSKYKPTLFPGRGNIDPANIHRAQGIDPSTSLEREEVKEIGRVGNVGFIRRTPTTTYSLTQFEYGNMEIYNQISGRNQDELTLRDFAGAHFDISAYLTDDDDNFRGTLWYPGLAVESFGISIGEPQGIIERTFDFTGETAIIWQNNNKYVIVDKFVLESGETSVELSKNATQDPDTENYLIKVTKYDVSAGTTTTLRLDEDYEFSAPKTITLLTDVETDDVIRAYYTSSEAPAADLFIPNDTDKPALLGDCADIFLFIPGTGKPSADDKVYRLQSASVEASLDREDYREIGNHEIVTRGVTDETVSVSLEGILSDHRIEEVLRGEGEDYGKLNVHEFTDRASLIVKIYDDYTKETFKYGFKATGLSPTDVGGGADVDAYVGKETTLEGSSLTITSNESKLGF